MGFPPELSRRPATDADTDWARAVHHESLRGVVEAQFGIWDQAQQDDFFAGDWSGGSFEILLCQGRPCGYVCLEDRAEDVHVRELVVAPEYQNRGIGTAIVRDAIQQADRRGVPVVLGTLHENRARALYRRLGFDEIGTTDTHTLYRRPPGTVS